MQYNNPNTECYSETLFVKNAENPKGVIVIPLSEDGIVSFSLKNRFSSSGLFADYNFLYVRVIVKKTPFPLNCYEQIINVNSFVHRIEKSSYYIINEQEKDPLQPASDAGANASKARMIYVQGKNLENIKDEIEKKSVGRAYHMPVEYTTKEKDAMKMQNYSKNFDVGLHYTPFFLLGPKLGIDKGAIGLLGVSASKNIGSKTAVLVNLNYSIANKTKTMEKLQNVSRDTINTHALFGAEVTFRKYFDDKKQLRYYSSAGLGFYSLLNVKLRRKQTSVSKKNNEDQYFTIVYDFGLQYRLSPALKVNAALPLKYFINNGGSGSLNTFGFGVNMGLSYTLNAGRIKKE